MQSLKTEVLERATRGFPLQAADETAATLPHHAQQRTATLFMSTLPTPLPPLSFLKAVINTINI